MVSGRAKVPPLYWYGIMMPGRKRETVSSKSAYAARSCTASRKANSAGELEFTPSATSGARPEVMDSIRALMPPAASWDAGTTVMFTAMPVRGVNCSSVICLMISAHSVPREIHTDMVSLISTLSSSSPPTLS